MSRLTVVQYVANKQERNKAVYRYHNGVGVYIYKGKEYTDKEFEELLPITPKIIKQGEYYKGENVDKSKVAH